MKIPIRNLYHLLLYAWDVLDHGAFKSVSRGDAESTLDLLIGVLLWSLDYLSKAGLDKGYVDHFESVSGIRGRIDFNKTISAGSISHRRMICTFDVLSDDIAHNQIIKSTLKLLLATRNLKPQARVSIKNHYRRLEFVSNTKLSDRSFREISLHRNNSRYRLPLAVCRMIAENTSLDELSGSLQFIDFIRDQEKMRRLFEAFVRNFLRHRLGRSAKIGARQFKWSPSLDEDSLLPTLNLDVLVERPDRLLVIDTKFTGNVLTFRHGIERVRTDHLYQIFSYVKNVSAHNPGIAVSGLLLYPQAEIALDSIFSLHGHLFRAATVDLNAPWNTIEQRIISLAS